ncbi:MAG: ImmA/IrrE family metallo-endopeptidase [Marinoscillum sp.]
MDRTKTRISEIAEFAQDISSFYFPDSKVNPEKIAKEQNISYEYEVHNDEFDGLLVYDNHSFHIEVNLFRLVSRSSPRARFTFCHELGHYFIDEHRNSLLRGGSLFHVSKAEYQSNLTVELEADTFASNLLMPQKQFLSFYKKGKFGFSEIVKTSKFFDVSLTATAVRLIQSDVRPSMIIKWDKEGKLDWKFYSRQFYHAGLGKTFDKGTLYDRRFRNSATDCALLGNTAPSCGYFESGTTASAWFPNSMAFKNDILIEQAFPIGEYGTLTLLFTDNNKFSFS